MAKRSRKDSSSSIPDISSSETKSESPDPGSELNHSTKYTHLGPEASSLRGSQVMRCSLPPHKNPISFASFEEYDVHYAKAHMNRCSKCGKNFPTEHFLGLHIEENHDPLMQARREKGEKTYGCFVEGCERKCSAPRKRRLHLIDKHMFPKTYNFYVVNDGIDKRSSMLISPRGPRRSVSSTQTPLREGPRRRRGFSQVSSNTCEQPQKEMKMINDGDGKDIEDEGNDSDESDDSEVPAAANGYSESAKMVLPVRQPGPPSNGANNAVSDLEESMSALRFVPTSVTLNRKARR